MADQCEQKDIMSDQVDEQNLKQSGVDDGQPEEKLDGAGAIPRGIASYNAPAHQEEFGQQEEPESVAPPSGDGAQGDDDDVLDVEPKHTLHSEDEPLPAPMQVNGDNDVEAGGDEGFEQSVGGDDGGVLAGANGESADRSSEESDVPVTGCGEKETAIPAADEQPSTVPDEAPVETPAAEEKSTLEEDRINGGVSPADGVGGDGGDSTKTGGPDGEPSSEIHGDDEPTFQEASATAFGELETAIPGTEDQRNVTDKTDAQAPAVPAAEEQPNVTDRIDAQTPAKPAAEEKPNVTGWTNVDTGPAAEEKRISEEDLDGGVKPGSVGDDGANSTVAGDDAPSTEAGDDEPSLEEATGDGEQEKPAAIAATAADDQPGQVTNGTDVETPAAEGKSTDTDTNPVVDDDSPATTTTPGAIPPTTNTTEEQSPKKEGFFSKLKDKVTIHHHPKSVEENSNSAPEDAPHPKKGLITKIKEKIAGDSD